VRLRITFSKNEAMRFTGHLDLHRTLERTFRRALLPVAYSKGFNPRPRLNLASALPLGFTSQGELAEVWLEEARPLEEIKQGLDESAPPGLTFLALEEIPDGTPKLPNLLRAAIYDVELDRAPADLEGRVAALLAVEALTRERKGKRYDLRPLIESLELHWEDDGERARLSMRLDARPGATGRPDEVLAALELPIDESHIRRRQLVLESEG
jgi:radical SAM-linked protein